MVCFSLGFRKSKVFKLFLGPSIQSCCYEIKEDVAKSFNRKYILNNENKIYLDLNKKVYDDLLNMVASEGRHTFISTGLSTLKEIDHAVDIFEKAGCSYELMHCVSTYPMRDEDANLKMIETLQKRYKCNVGYSGHEVGLAVSYAAAALGISSLERHITLDRAMYGSDQSASVEPNGFKTLISAVRKIELALGDGQKRILDQEVSIAEKLREHLNWESGE